MGFSCCCGLIKFTPSHVPVLIFTSNLISALAAGMTVKFFPTFFHEEVGLSPAWVSGVYVITPVVMMVVIFFSQKIAVDRGIGRIETVQLQRLMGTVLLALLAIYPSLWKRRILVVSIYVMRTVLTSAGWPLINSVMNDYTTKRNRAMWNSLQSLAGFSWSGSAALGGQLISRYGFDMCFGVTAGIQCLALLIRLVVMQLVPRRQITRSMRLAVDARLPGHPRLLSQFSPAAGTGSRTGLHQLPVDSLRGMSLTADGKRGQ